MPKSLAHQATAWCEEHVDLCNYPATLTVQPTTKTFIEQENLSQTNIVVPFTPHGDVIKIAAPGNVFCETVSRLGINPYDPNELQKLGGPKEVIMEPVLTRATTIRRFKAVSAVAYYRLMSQLESNYVQSPKTFAFHIPWKLEELDDRNYLVVQEALSKTVIALGNLPEPERTEIIGGLDTKALYGVLKKIGAWNWDDQTLLVDTKNSRQLWVSDLENPNNEGYGNQAKWQVAVFGKGGQSDDPSKWLHNIHTGHEQVANILTSHPEKQNQWMALLANDLDVKD